MAALPVIAVPPPLANNNLAPQAPEPLQSDRYREIIAHFIAYAIPAFLGLLMIIFLAIPAVMPPEFGLHPGSSLSSLNISTSHVTTHWNIALSIKNPSKLIAIKYTHMKLLLSFQEQLTLSHPSLIPAFTQGPDNVTIVRAKALSKLLIENDWGVKDLVGELKGGMVTIDIVVKARRRLHLGLWWVAVFDVYFSCMDVTFTAPTDSEGGGKWMILGGTLGCTPDTITILW
ncbi:hypothetical protein ACJRO7_009655 [Eucalyptus globulus]|uniref:Late embryogenesis abundant protein LEA-2 subgroup domain-containing protein n=1 Tax=Eucalyptus globulus TaxID=34317 RepID=A0ABD3L9I7_EUCGL